MRAGGGFRMILDGKGSKGFMFKPFKGVVIQVNVGDFNIILGQAVHVEDKSMILRGDLYLAGRKMLHRMVGAMVTEFQLACFSSQGKPKNLVAHADAKDWLFPK